ncbi:MAG TPA: hypothetical protein VHE81_16650 [Lacipirellulaceae bacterium]|nr:hypothetical protein [Lacipirellulaceae bacterium]
MSRFGSQLVSFALYTEYVRFYAIGRTVTPVVVWVKMKLASALFFALLVYVHRVAGLAITWERPLSSFRSGEYGWLGYALFCVIAVIGLLYLWSIRRFGASNDDIDSRGFFIMLALVVATPSNWVLHEAAAAVMLGALYLYFATVFYRVSLPLFTAHLPVPCVLAIATGFHSYGSWQKLVITYYVIAAIVHAHMLKRQPGAATAA